MFPRILGGTVKIQWDFEEFGIWGTDETFVFYFIHNNPPFTAGLYEFVTAPTLFVIAVTQGGP